MGDFNSEDYLTRQEASSRLGISDNSLWLRTSRGEFHPMRLGVRVFYLRDEIEDAVRKDEDIRGKVLIGRLSGKSMTGRKLEKQAETALGMEKAPKNSTLPKALPYTGDEAARAFNLFDAGKNKRQIVEVLKLRCDVIEHLYEKWKEFGDELHISPKMLEIMRSRFKWVESPPTANGLWAALVVYIDQEIRRRSKKGAYEPITDEERRLLDAEKPTIEGSLPEEPGSLSSKEEPEKRPILPEKPNSNINDASTPKTSEPDDGSLPFC
jgi:predicted DNA-binding transcriptional regulator AlpA